MERYNGTAMLRQNDQVLIVRADFDYMIDSQDDHRMNRVEGSFEAPLEIPSGMEITEGSAEIVPVELDPKSGDYLPPEFHAIMVRLSEKTEHPGDEEKVATQIWTIIDNAHEQQGFEIPNGVNLGGGESGN